MSESTKVTKSESEKVRSFMSVRRNFSSGGNVNILFIIFKLLTISVPSKIILHWANVCFSEHDYLGMNKWSFQWITNFVNYIINIQSYQNTKKITFHSNSFLFACFSIALQCCKYARMIFHCATVLVVLSICALWGNISDDAMQMDGKSLHPFYTTKEMPHVTVTITKNALLAAVARHISITIIYTLGYLQIFNTGHLFSSRHCHDL